jgi:threonine/homoserine/homoserine lactone efflux protein
MSINEYLIFFIVTFTFMLSPGPSTFNCMNNGIRYGARKSVVGVLGNVVAFQLLIALSVIGLGAVLAASEIAFQIIKIIGAFYLVYLGVKIWISQAVVDGHPRSEADVTSLQLCKRAFLVTMSNPKALIYISALLPQFININQPSLSQFLLIALTIGMAQFVAFSLYAILSSRARYWLSNKRNRQLFNRASGLTFMGFGVALGLSGR